MFIAELVLQVLSYVVQREMSMSVQERYEKMLATSICIYKSSSLELMKVNGKNALVQQNK